MNISLLGKQLEVLRSKATLTIYLGGVGSGKTFVSAVWAVTKALRGRTVLILEPTFSMCRDVYLKTLEEVLARMGLSPLVHFTVNLSTLTVTFVGGGCIMIRSGDAVERVRGINAHDVGVDEMGSLRDEEPYKILIGRMRKSKDGQVLLTGTPTGYAWVKQLCESPGAHVVRMTSLENHFLPVSYLNNMAQAYGIGTAWYRQEVLGEFVDIGQGVIPADRIAILEHQLPHRKYVCRAWDTASSSGTQGDYTATALVSMDETGRAHIHGYDRKRGPYAQVRPWIVQTIRGDGKDVEQIFEATQGGLVIMQDIAAMRDFHGFRFASVTPTRDKVTRALAFASKVSLGQVSVTRGPGFGDWMDELKNFPKTPHDDYTDALVHAVGGCVTAGTRVAKNFTHQLF